MDPLVCRRWQAGGGKTGRRGDLKTSGRSMASSYVKRAAMDLPSLAVLVVGGATGPALPPEAGNSTFG